MIINWNQQVKIIWIDRNPVIVHNLLPYRYIWNSTQMTRQYLCISLTSLQMDVRMSCEWMLVVLKFEPWLTTYWLFTCSNHIIRQGSNMFKPHHAWFQHVQTISHMVTTCSNHITQLQHIQTIPHIVTTCSSHTTHVFNVSKPHHTWLQHIQTTSHHENI